MTWHDLLDPAEAAAERDVALHSEQLAAAQSRLTQIRSARKILLTLEAEAAATPDNLEPNIEPDIDVDAEADVERKVGPDAEADVERKVGPDADVDAEADVEPAVEPNLEPAAADGTLPTACEGADQNATSTTPRLKDVDQRTLDVVSSASEPMRAREVLQALGESDASRSVLEGTRSRLKRLARAGHLTERDGKFSPGKPINGYAQQGAASTDQ